MSDPKDKIPDHGQIRFADAEPQHDVSTLAVFVVDASGKVLSTAPLDKEGRFKLSSDARGASKVVIAPAPAKGQEPDLAKGVEFHAADFAQRFAGGTELVVPRDRWSIIFPIRRCVTGSIRKCWPILLDEIPNFANAATTIRLSPSIFPFCSPVCNALVEVFRRVCCCEPWIYLDPRIDQLKIRLQEVINATPIGPRPGPGPGPDPGPLTRLAQPISGIMPVTDVVPTGVDADLATNASADLLMLQKLNPSETFAYISERPYLTRFFCRCGPPFEVAQDFVHPDGTFSVCWNDPIWLLLPGCHVEYAFKVSQLINGQTVVIYNGVAAGRWFTQSSGINLTTYDRRAITCHSDPGPIDTGDAYVMLQDIGITGTYRLSTPNADGAFSVGTPAIHSGLFDADAVVDSPDTSKNRNLGGTLRLRIHFSNVVGASMKALGATHYRVSVAAVDAVGDPTGDRRYYDDTLHWLYYQVDPSHHITVESDLLGPFTIGAGASTRSNVYKIPYTDDRDWQDGQWHSFIITPEFADGRYLVTIEVFKNDGTRLRPTGAPALGDGAEAAAGFKFLQWKEYTGPTSTHEVPFAALTNLLWWDNRPPYSELVSLSGSGGSGADCQFLSGHGTDTLAIVFKAYHPNPLFIAGRSLVAYRGLHDTTGNAFTLPPVNFAAPTADVTSSPKTLNDLLGPTMKCSFALVLATSAKTTDGIGAVWGSAVANGAFALEKI